jgi:hypothetical protein
VAASMWLLVKVVENSELNRTEAVIVPSCSFATGFEGLVLDVTSDVTSSMQLMQINNPNMTAHALTSVFIAGRF